MADEGELRRALFEHTGGSYPEVCLGSISTSEFCDLLRKKWALPQRNCCDHARSHVAQGDHAYER